MNIFIFYFIFLLIIMLLILINSNSIKNNTSDLKKIRLKSEEELNVSEKNHTLKFEKFQPQYQITTIITTSPILCMKNINIISETIDSLFINPILVNNHVIICFDGGPLDPNNIIDEKCANLGNEINIYEYETYKNKVKAYALTLLPYVSFSELLFRGCLTNNIHNSFHMIKTEYINIMQHDLPIIKSFDIESIIKIMEHDKLVKLVRYVYDTNNFHNEYTKNFIKYDPKKYKALLPMQKKIYGDVILTICSQWSDQNHITSKKYYEDVVFPVTLLKGSFMEHFMFCLPIEDHKKYGTWFLGEIYDGYYIKHTDGRNNIC